MPRQHDFSAFFGCRVSGSQHVPLKSRPHIFARIRSSCVLRAGNGVYGETKVIGYESNGFSYCADRISAWWLDARRGRQRHGAASKLLVIPASARRR